MSEYELTPQAADDLFEIWSHIARDSVEAASSVESAIFGACDSLAATPLGGHVRKDLSGLPVRFWPSNLTENTWWFTIHFPGP
jgi:plasmid stabilization system protein ParE